VGYENAVGWPIASGVFEGACRHLIKNKLDLTGTRWSLADAEAVLLLRAVIVNGDDADGVVMPIGVMNRLVGGACTG
jgi:hypothetical protein